MALLRDGHVDDLATVAALHHERLFELWNFDLTNLGTSNEVDALVASFDKEFAIWFGYLKFRSDSLLLEVEAHEVDLVLLMLSHHKDAFHKYDIHNLRLVNGGHMLEILP